MESSGRIVSRDKRDFTEAEYLRELEMHHVKLEKGQTASSLYRAQPASVKTRPQTGIFRDFFEYGVHPARVVVERIRITIPFLVSSFTPRQISMEITNQTQRKEARKKPDARWPEEEEALKTERPMITPSGGVRFVPSLNAAYELVDLLRRRKKFIEFTPALQYYISALNLYLFHVGDPSQIDIKFLTPPRSKAITDLIPIISKEIITNEIAKRRIHDPSHWSSSPEAVTVNEAAQLIGELMSDTAYTFEMRQIIEWYKLAYRRGQITTMIERIILNQNEFLSVIRLRMPLTLRR